MRRQISIKQIAEMAGVNPSTVSRVLNGDTRYSISEEVRNRVRQLAEAHAYAPLGSARALAQKKSFNIALILDQIEQDMCSSDGAVFLGALCREITRRRYTACLLPATGDDVDAEVLRCIRGSNADAYFIGGLMAGSKTLKELAGCHTPAATYIGDTQVLDPLPGVSTFSFDTDIAYRELFKEAATRGFRRTALFVSEGHRRMTQRVQSMLLAPEYGIEISDILSFPAENKLTTRTSASRTAAACWEQLRNQEMILCSTDLIAMGICDLLREKGVTPGREISVIGFDNLERQPVYAPDNGEPFLATVDQHLAEIGRTIATFLLARIDDKNPAVEKNVLKTTFIAGPSMGHPRKSIKFSK